MQMETCNALHTEQCSGPGIICRHIIWMSTCRYPNIYLLSIITRHCISTVLVLLILRYFSVNLVIVSAWYANTKALEQNTIKLLTTGDATMLCSRVTASRRRRTAWNYNTCQLKTCSPCNTNQERKLILMGHPFSMISRNKIVILRSAIFVQLWRFPRSPNFCCEMLLCTTRATLFSFKTACMQTVVTV